MNNSCVFFDGNAIPAVDIHIINVLKENVMNSNSKYNRNEWHVHIYVCEKARNKIRTYFRYFPHMNTGSC